jgi:hypothetical protein
MAGSSAFDVRSKGASGDNRIQILRRCCARQSLRFPAAACGGLSHLHPQRCRYSAKYRHFNSFQPPCPCSDGAELRLYEVSYARRGELTAD